MDQATVLAAIIGAVVAIFVMFITNNATKMNELDSKSGWREKLFDLASKDMMTLDDVYMLRATLRFNIHEEPFELYSFKYMSNEITIYCDWLTNVYKLDKRDSSYQVLISNEFDRERIRIYARYLLKNHWEVFSSKIFFFSNEFKIKKEHSIGYETALLINNVNEVEGRKQDSE